MVTELRDDMGRSVGYTYTKNGTVQQTVSTGYGTDGRIATAGFVHGEAVKQFNYVYLNGTNLLQTLTMPNNMTLTQSFEEKRDLLTQMDYKRGATLVTRRQYTYDSLARPLTRTTSRQGQTINDSFVHTYRSELASAQVNGETYGYDYDNIGNRRMSMEASDYAFYEANNLNQYTSIQRNEEEAFVPSFDADGNQTLVRTATGIWSVTYNAENRPEISQKITDSVIIRITCTYDSMGRRATKKVEEITTDAEGNESSTLISHHHFIYRGYLQIACCDLTRANHPCLWLITWDPIQPVATRPLAIQKDGTWFCYGWDLTKNICEVFGQNGYIRTAYNYTPYGSVTANGDITQPIQWSGEYADTELALSYYNYRHYNPMDGRWLGRDFDKAEELTNLYHYVYNNPIYLIDFNGLQTKICVSYKNNEQIIDEVREEFHPILQWIGDKIDIWNLLKTFDRRMKADNCTKISTTVVLQNADLLAKGGFNSYSLIRQPKKGCTSKLCFAGRGIGGMRNKGERNLTRKPSGTPSPFKHMKPDPKIKIA